MKIVALSEGKAWDTLIKERCLLYSFPKKLKMNPVG